MRELFTPYPPQLLGGGLLVLLGILVRFFPNLIAGYNTMSAEQKKNVDVKGLSRFMCLRLAAIGIGWIALGMLAGILGGEKWVLAVDFLWLPAGCVFLLGKAQKYDRNKKTGHTGRTGHIRTSLSRRTRRGERRPTCNPF